MLVNTREFQRAAMYFKKYGVYTKAPNKTTENRLFWEEETRRCLEGIKIGDTYISGYHYFYLNYSKINRTPDTFGTVHDMKAKHTATEKEEDFPAFWDGDHIYFNVVERCENPHNPLIDIRGITLPENDLLRKHLFVLKARGKGFSFKGGSMMERNYALIRKSKSFAIASGKEFLIEDGILNKAWDIMNFVDQNTAWRKRRLKDGEMMKQSGFKERIGGVETAVGYKSQIIGVTLKNDIQKARGKRGKLILWEEVGKFPGFKDAWNIARPSVEDGDQVTGFMIAQGTGGTEGANFEDIEEMFYHPEAYNALAIENVWDEGGAGTQCGLFFPNYWNLGSFQDENGNSHVEEAIAFEDNQREIIARNASSPNDIDKRAAEHPHNPREACLSVSGNIFPKILLTQHLNKLMVSKDMNMGTPIELEYFHDQKTHSQQVRISTDPQVIEKLKPIIKFPTPKDAGEGCIVMYEEPYRRNGKIPDNLYYVANDPFAQSGGLSLGSCGVYKRTNRWSSPDDICVAEYDGRPPSTLDYDRRMFMLAEFYNAMIGFENDRGDVLSNARLLKKIHLLESQFTLEYNNDLRDSPVARPYGMNMTEGRKIAGEGYVNDDLRTVRGHDPTTGNLILNLNMIRSIPMIQELIAYNRKGNFDRVSRFIVASFYKKELDYTETKVEEEKKGNDFLTREFFFGEGDNGYAADDTINVYDSGSSQTLMF